jgi:hypothetical protein
MPKSPVLTLSTRLLITIASWETPRSTLDTYRGYYGESPGGPAGRSGAGLEGSGPETRLFGAPNRGLEGSPRHRRQVKGQSRGSAWRVILQGIPVTIFTENSEEPSHSSQLVVVRAVAYFRLGRFMGRDAHRPQGERRDSGLDIMLPIG